MREDGRPMAEQRVPANKLSEDERARVLATCHQPQFASGVCHPARSYSRWPTTACIWLLNRRSTGRCVRPMSSIIAGAHVRDVRSRRRHPIATKACEVWSWDITWLAGPVRGVLFYLYQKTDVLSRKIVGWEVYERECGEHAAEVIRRAVLAEGVQYAPHVLHADNGSPMKGATLRTTLQQLGIEPS